MTLREEVLRNSGLLTEEILEEGFFKKALTIAAIIAALGGAAIGGGKLARSVKQYNAVKNTPVATRYEKADVETNKDIHDKEYLLDTTAYTVKYRNLQYVDEIKSEYNERNHQAILHVYVDNHVLERNTFNQGGRIETELRHALSDYIKNLKKEYSGIEDKINAIKGKERFNTAPLKVVIHFTDIPTSDRRNIEELDNDAYNLAEIVRDITGTASVEYQYDYKSKY